MGSFFRASVAALFFLSAPAGAQITEIPEIEGFAAAYAEADAARQAIIAGDMTAGIALARPLAEAGNPVAQNLLGVALTEPGVAGYDPDEGMLWLMRAGAQGYGKAWHNLGDIWSKGEGPVARDPSLSLAAFRTAAGLGYEPSFEPAVRRLLDGDGVADPAAGIALLDQGRAVFPDNIALHEIEADTHYFGLGREAADHATALALFQEVLALAPQRSYAAYSVGYMLMHGEGTERDMAAALPLLESAAAAGSVLAIVELPIAHGHPDFAGDHADPVRGLAWCRVAAGAGLLEEAGPDSDTVLACETLEATLSADEIAAADALAADL